MKVLVVFDQWPFPEDANGINKVICNLLKFDQSMQLEILTSKDETFEDNQLFFQIHSLNLKQVKSKIEKSFEWIIGKLPMACASKKDWYLDSSDWLKVNGKNYDIIHIFGAHNMPILQSLPNEILKKTLMSCIDTMSLFFERRSIRYQGIKKWLFEIESAKWARLELRTLQAVAIVHVVSTSDSLALEKWGLKNIRVIENGVVRPNDSLREGQECNVTFWGDLGYGPNKEALSFLVNKVNKDGKFKIKIFGKNADSEIIKNSHVKYLGFVPQIRDLLTLKDVFVCPLFYGTGLKNKLLEAFSFQLPVVTSSISLEGLDAEFSKCCYVIDSEDPLKWQNKIEQAINEYPVVFKERAKKIIDSKYSWSSKREQLNNLYMEIIKS